MPRKTAVSTAEHALQLIPVATSTTKVTKKNLAKVAEKQLIDNIEPMLIEAFEALRQGVRAKNPKSIELAFQVAGVIQGSKAPSVVANIYNKNRNDNRAEATSASASSSKTTFESLVRRLEARDAQDRQTAATIDAQAS